MTEVNVGNDTAVSGAAVHPGIQLQDGEAHYMGDGSFVVLQKCEMDGPQNVVIQEEDLRLMLSILG